MNDDLDEIRERWADPTKGSPGTGFCDVNFLLTEVDRLHDRLDEARRAVSKALPLLRQVEESGLPSCGEAARRALVNPDQHDSGCRVRGAIAAGQRVVDSHFSDTQAAIDEHNPPG